MSASTYHIRKTSLGLKRKYRIFDDDGAGRPGTTLGYAEKLLKASDELVIYRDEKHTDQLARVREDITSLLASLTGYEVFDGAGDRMGSFGVLVKRSLQRTTWTLNAPGVGQLVGSERSLKTARARRLVSFAGGTAGELINAVTKFHFDFRLDEQLSFSIDKPKILDDWYRITIADQTINRTLIFALTIAMEFRLRG